MKFIIILLVFFLPYAYADTYDSFSSNLDTSSPYYIASGSVKKNNHDQFTVTMIEDGDLSVTLGGANLATVRLIASTVSMPEGGTASSYGPQSFSAGEKIYVSVNAPGETAGTSYSITFTLSPANNTPTNITLSSSNISENLAAGAVIGTLSSTDADLGDTHTYSLVSGTGDNDNGSFNISGANLISNEVFDFETKDTYAIRLQTDDGNAGTYEKQFTITIDDEVEGIAPTITSSQVFSINEAATNGESLGTVATTNSPTSFSILSGNSDNIFTIDNFGEIIVSNNTNLDYDTTNSYTLEINASNAYGSDVENVTINIDEGPTPEITTPQTFTVSEAVANGISLGTVVTTNSPTSFSILSGNSDNIFTIDNFGEIIVSDNTNLDYSTTNLYTLEINASNAYGNDVENITVNVTQSSVPPDSNNYSCGIFSNVIVTYDYLDLSGTTNARACGTQNVSYPSGQISGSIDCLTDIACGGTGSSCDRSDPPANRLSYTWTHPDDPTILNESPSTSTPLTNESYGNLSFSGGSVEFKASSINTLNNNNYMYVGDASFDQTLITFHAGDYYFESFTISKNKNNTSNFLIDTTNGPVRIFIKNNLSFDLNNLYLNHSGVPSDLFIYIGGDFSNPGNGGGNTHMNAFFYVEGNVDLNNNSNNWIIEGGITTEGRFTIAGNNPDFIETSDSGNLGYGNCSLCFQVPQNSSGEINTNILNNGNDLSSVVISKAYDYSGYTTTDHNTTTGNSTTSSAINMDGFYNTEYTNFSSVANGFIYTIGDFNTTNSVTISDTTSISFNLDDYNITQNNRVNSKALHIANYYDGDKNYNDIVEMCWDSGVSLFEITGPFDAWDTFRDNNINPPSDRNISTKIVNQPFKLSLASLNETFDAYQTKQGSGANVEVAVYPDGSLNAISNTITFDANTSSHIPSSSDFIVSNAEQNAVIGFKICATYENQIYTLYPVAQCSSAVLYACDEETSVKSMHLCRATDNLAIRPDKFTLSSTNPHMPNLLRAGTDYNLTINAYDENNVSSLSYNRFSSELNFVTSKLAKDLSATSMNGTVNWPKLGTSFTITNGSTVSDVATMNFNNVGKVTLNVMDVNWSIVDNDDTPGTCDENNALGSYTIPNGRYICGEHNITFIPHHFGFTDTNVTNNNKSNFTYLSNLNPNDQSTFDMSARILVTVVAQDENNNTATNFQTGNAYYEYPISVVNTTSLSPYEDANSTHITTALLGFNNGEYQIASNSDANLSKVLRFNFPRETNLALNPFRVTTSDINVSVTSPYSQTAVTGYDSTASITGAKIGLDNGEAIFIYGRSHAGRQKYVGGSGTANIYYEAYCFNTDSVGISCNKALLPQGNASTNTSDIRWFRNTSHLMQDGNISIVQEKIGSNLPGDIVDATDNPIGNPSSSTLTYDETRGYPYITTMENNASRWLIYNEDDPTATRNQFSVEFNKASDGWAGEHETNTTTKGPGTVKTNRRSMW